jgi:hypothetical protein
MLSLLAGAALEAAHAAGRTSPPPESGERPPEDARPTGRDALPDPELVDRIIREDRDLERRVAGLWRARLSDPLFVSAGVGAIVVKMPSAYECVTVCEWRGLMAMADAGVHGAQVDVGWGVVVADQIDREHFLSRVYMAYGLKASVMRTWGDSGLNPPDQTLAGVEGEFNIIGLNISLGVYRHVGGGDPEDDWILAGGLGWGF